LGKKKEKFLISITVAMRLLTESHTQQPITQ